MQAFLDWQSLTLVAMSVIAVTIALWISHRRRTTFDAILNSAPIGVMRLSGDAWTHTPLARQILLLEETRTSSIGTDEILACFDEENARTLRQAMDRLVRSGIGFEMTLELAEGGRVVDVKGRAIPRPSLSLPGTSLPGGVADVLPDPGRETMLWIADGTAGAYLAHTVSEKDTENTFLRNLLDHIPIPVWWRDQENWDLVGCNKAYAKWFERPRREVLDEGLEIGSRDRAKGLARRVSRTGVAQSESQAVVVGGNRRIVDITETPVEGVAGTLGGFARDMTALEDLQSQLARHIAVHDQVLERMGTAIAVYGPDKRLRFYNESFARLWDLPTQELDQQPSIIHLLERLREERRLPEMADFRAFRDRIETMFTSVIDAEEMLLHLPDERTIRQQASPHPLGGLIFQYEDVTDRLALERSHNTLTAVQRLTLDSLYEGVCVYGSDGRLKLFNDQFAEMVRCDPDWLRGSPHVSELLENMRDLLPQTDDWPARKQRLILSVTEPRQKAGRMELADGHIVDYAYVPLPDGQCLVLYLDVTDSVHVERALKERNSALENADLLKAQFVASVSYELRSPLNAIVGFSEMLRAELFGPLNERQTSYVENILDASLSLSILIGDILDLAAVQAGFLEFERERIDIGELLEGLAQELEPQVAESQLSLEVDLSADLGTVIGDRKRLLQAFRRLVDNAVFYTPAGGKVSLAARRYDEKVQVTVADTGSGIAESDEMRVMQASAFGADIRGLQQMTGAGIGLALAKSLLEAHNGTLTLIGADAHGSIALGDLPVEVSQEERQAPRRIGKSG